MTTPRALLMFSFLGCLVFGCAEGELQSRPAGLEAESGEGPPLSGRSAAPGTPSAPALGQAAPASGPARPEDEAPGAAPPAPLTLRLSEPARGARIFGGTARIVGRLEGGTQPTLTVAGTRVDVGPDGAFSVEAPVHPGLNVLLVDAVEGTQRVEDRRALLVDADAEPSAPVEHAAAIHVAASAFPKLSRKLSDFARTLDVQALVAGNAGDGLSVLEARFDALDVDLIPRDGFLEARVAARGLYVRVQAEVEFGFTFTFTGSARANPARVSGRLAVGARPDGSLALDISGTEVALDGFDYDVEGIPDFVEDWFEGRVRTLAEDTVRDALADFVVPSLFDPAALRRTVEVLGAPIEVGLKLNAASVTSAGLDLRADATATAPQAIHPEPAVRPTAGAVSTIDGSDLDVAAGVDLLNRLLHATWAAGVLDLTLDEASGLGAGLPLKVALLAAALGDAADGIPLDTPVVLSLRPLLPPVARLEKGDRPLVVETGDLLLDVGTAEHGTLVTVALHFVARGAVQVETLEAITLDPDLAVEVHADVAETPRGAVDEAAVEQLVQTFAGVIPGLIADQTFAFGTDVLPVPLGLSGARLEADARGDWLHLLTNLE